MKPSEPPEDMIAAPLPIHIIPATTGAEAVIIIITMIVPVLSGRRRRKREVGVGVDEGVGAGVSRVAAAAIVGHPPTEEKEKVGGKGEGSEGRTR